MNFHDNSKNTNWKIDFSFVSGHCASFMIVGSKTEGGGVCVSLVGTEPKQTTNFSICFQKHEFCILFIEKICIDRNKHQ